MTPYETIDDVIMNNERQTSNDDGNDKTVLDGLIVCTPTFTHKDVIQEATKYQLDVFVEKPVGETSTEIEYLYQLANNANIQLCCSFQRRFDVSYKHASDTVRNGDIGNPLLSYIFFADHPVPSKSFLLTGGNIFMDLAAHVRTHTYIMYNKLCYCMYIVLVFLSNR